MVLALAVLSGIIKKQKIDIKKQKEINSTEK